MDLSCSWPKKRGALLWRERREEAGKEGGRRVASNEKSEPEYPEENVQRRAVAVAVATHFQVWKLPPSYSMQHHWSYFLFTVDTRIIMGIEAPLRLAVCGFSVGRVPISSRNSDSPCAMHFRVRHKRGGGIYSSKRRNTG